MQFNKYTHKRAHTHTHTSLIPPGEDQREWHRMTRMTGPDCAVMCILMNAHIHTHIPPWEDQCEWHRMTRMTGPDCAMMCNLINTHTHTQQVSLIPPWEDQCERHRMTRMTGPDCAVMCNLINTHTHTHTHTPLSRLIRGFVTSIIDPPFGRINASGIE